MGVYDLSVMKLIFKKLLNVLICFLIMFLWGGRYIDWGIDYTLVISFLMISGGALIVILNALTIYGSDKLLNPYTIFCFFIFLFGYSFIPLSKTNEQIDAYSFIILLTSVLFFLIGIFIGKRIKVRCKPLSNLFLWRTLIFRIVVFLSVFVFLLECLRIGFVPMLYMLQLDVYSIMNEKAIPVLHYFVQSAYIVPIWALLLYRTDIISIKERNVVIAISTFIIFNNLSRQMWLLTILCIGIYYMSFYRLTTKRLLVFVSVPIFLFLLLGAVRLATVVKDDRNDVEYLKDYSQIDYDVNLVEVYMGLYSSANFTTFKKFVHESNEKEYRGYGVYTLKPIYTLLGLNLLDNFDINKEFNSFAALGTYAIEPYLDFGLIGVVFINLIYGVFVGYSYRQYKIGRKRWIIPWALMIFCMIMACFTNYYNTFFIWFVLILNFFILPPSSYQYDKCFKPI